MHLHAIAVILKLIFSDQEQICRSKEGGRGDSVQNVVYVYCQEAREVGREGRETP